MPTYTAQHRSPSNRRHLPRRTAIVLTMVSLLFVCLLAVSRSPVHAAPSHNRIFTTFSYVQNAISTALAPIRSAITNLQAQQNILSTQLNNLQGSQGSNSHELTAYDANGTKLGLLVSHGGTTDIIYSSTLGKFIELSDNEYGGANLKFIIADSNGVGNVLIESPVYYQSTDCTGTPFLITSASPSNNNYALNAHDVLSFGDGKAYFVFHPPEPAQTFTPGSYKTYDAQSATATCTPDGSTSDNRQYTQLYPVSLPFPLPVAEPLQFKNQ